MHDLHAVVIASCQIIQRYHIFRIMVFDFEQIGSLPVRFLRQLSAHLNVDALVTPHCHKINVLYCKEWQRHSKAKA